MLGSVSLGCYGCCWLIVNERQNILVGVTHPLEQGGKDTGRAKTRRTPPRKIAATDNRGPKTAIYAPTEKGVRWSSAFPINSQRLPIASRALCRPFFRSDCTERRGLIASPLVQMEPPARHQLLQLDGQPPCLIK
ncbi:hypothetical protein T03_13453 [Trichinella britovi]|uniref:Uncharacterized protein n=1 Tax=Trichinella britovi TaxID=45882 RepID=A0A0V1C8K1_TRIBR|nr:hypothetical protein T03_13453 [Trichinella britovi]